VNWTVDNEYGIPYFIFFIWTQAYVNLRKIYINLENHREYVHKPYIARVIGLIFVADSMGLSSFKFSWWALKDA